MFVVQNLMYDHLLALCEGEDSPFYFVDQEYYGNTYRIFLYRLASYSDFMKPYAMWARGTTFLIARDGVELGDRIIVSLPFAKFFNYKENPITMDVDFSEVDYIQTKLDGSLISTIVWDDGFLLKSKGSLKSDQAIDSMNWVKREEHCNLHNFLTWCSFAGYTVNMEWTAPHNRVVLGYDESRLRILNVMDHMTGEEMSLTELKAHLDEFMIQEYFEDVIEVDSDKGKFAESIYDMTGLEGYVITFKNGQKIKIKTDWYCSLHQAKDSVNTPRRLFEVVVNEGHDDLRAMFSDDSVVLSEIDVMEAFVKEQYLKFKPVEDFYNQNKGWDRKTYALTAKDTFEPMYFHTAMGLYSGKDIDYKALLLHNWDELGFNTDR